MLAVSEPRLSVIIACHNETQTIERKLDNCLALLSTEPLEILVVDDHSSDGTAQAAADVLRARLPLPAGRTVRLLTNHLAPGKNGALQTAFAEARGAVLLVTDADIYLDRDVLSRGCAYFGADPQLGALCLSPAITSADAEAAADFAGAYERFNRWLKMQQSRLDSVPILHGQAMFLRAGIGLTPHPDLPADDVDFAIQVRLQGFRVRYAPEIPFHERISSERHMVCRQKRRRAIAVMRSLWHHRRVLLNPRYGLFGLLCFPADFFLYFALAPLLAAAGVAAAAWAVSTLGLRGAGLVVLALAVLALPRVRAVSLYVGLLLTAAATLLLERTPRIRWRTQRSAISRSA